MTAAQAASMILATRLQVPPGSPWWMSLGADVILFLHIAGGALALASGAIALFARKGGRVHTAAGLTFCALPLCLPSDAGRGRIDRYVSGSTPSHA